MTKAILGPQPLIYPMPALLVGAVVAGKPNFMTVAWAGIANADPPMISVALRRQRHTLEGINRNMAFSVNVPSTDLVKETDYCGLVSGHQEDKTSVCHFKVFYGTLEGAPLIEQCPINLECRVHQTIELGSHTLVIGKIEQTHISEDCLTGGKPDLAKIKPLIYARGTEAQYHALGRAVAPAFSIGKKLK